VPASPARIGSQETGIASWYGEPYHGRKTASGETYNMHGFTAAHRKLPFHTWLKVRNLTNQQEVVVRINDRGPFVKGRIIDLSRRAAQEIQMIGPGTAKVRITVIKPPKRPPSIAGN
jgi:rare lipoprotein A